MIQKYRLTAGPAWAAVMALALVQSAGALAQDGTGTAPPATPLVPPIFVSKQIQSVPKVEHKKPVHRGPDGREVPAPVRTITINTRPETVKLNALKPATKMVPLDHPTTEGSTTGQAQRLPFGTKGERVSITFNSGEFFPPANEKLQPALTQQAPVRGANNASAVYGLILVNGHMDDSLKSKLDALGVSLFGFYPNAAFRALIPTASLNQVAAIPQVRWVGQPGIAQKIHPDLYPLLQATGADAQKPIQVYVSFFGPDTDGQARSLVANSGAKLGYYDTKLAIQVVDTSVGALSRIAASNPVMYVSPVRTGHTMNFFGMSTVNADFMWGVNDPASNNAAQPIKIGLLDTGFYPYHQDFSNLFVGNSILGYSLVSGENWWDDLNHHGTHVSGTILGEGNANSAYRGVAAGLVGHNDANNPDYLIAQVFDKTGHGNGATLIDGMNRLDLGFSAGYQRQVINFSGGGYGTSGSDPEAQKVDSLYSDGVLMCIAAGNNGPGIVGTPGDAKGALTVGAIYDNTEGSANTDGLTGYSAVGPTSNALHKPDIVSPGSYVDSTQAGTSNGYLYDWQGTSMATPHVVGIAAGLLAHFPMTAWAAKAVICANGIDVGYDRNHQGLGKIDAVANNYAVDGNWHVWWSGNGATGNVQYVDIYLGSPQAQVKFVMTYPDPPAPSGSSSILVNDLDLYVQYSADGTGLTTDRFGNWSDLGVDPVSIVTLNNAPAGWYRVKMYSYRVSGGQQWAMAAHWITSTIYPNISFNLTVPYAIQPNVGFYADATATDDNYIATGVVGSVSMDAGLAMDGVWYKRQGRPSSGVEWFWLPNPDPGGDGYYEAQHINMGNISVGNTRELEWVLHGTSEGSKNVTFGVNSFNGGSGSTTQTVIVDGTAPTIGTAEGRNWTQALHCDVYAPTQDTLSGLNTNNAWYRYSTDNGATWNGWYNTTCTGAPGSTAVETIICPDVPFNQNNANNLIQLYITDMAGNYLYSANMTVTTPVVSGLSLSPSIVPGGNNVTATVTLSGNAPTGGASVAVTNTNPKASAPATMTVAQGTNSGTFTITTVGVTSTYSGTVSASYGGATMSAALKVRPVNIKLFTFTPPKVVGASQNSTGNITLDAPAPVNTTVTLTSNKPTVGSVPASIVIAAGSSTGSFTLTSFQVSADTVVTVTAKANGVAKTANCTVTPVHLFSLTMSPTSIVGGWSTSTGTVKLDANAPSNTTVTLTSNNPSVGSVPASVTVPAGSISATFTMSSSQVAASTIVTISAHLNAVTKNANVTVKPVAVTAVSCTPNPVKGGLNTTGKVTISGPAAPGGLVVTLGTTNAAVAAPASGTVTVPAGATTATFTVHTSVVAVNSSATISAAANGSNKTVILKTTP